MIRLIDYFSQSIGSVQHQEPSQIHPNHTLLVINLFVLLEID